MAEKRYYWLKLKEDYFSSPKIKKLRKIAGGDTYTIIYLKMQLLSVSNKGIIQFDGIEATLEEELALKLDEDVDNVTITLNYLKAQSLIEENNNEYLLLDASKNIGSESESAERVRQFRLRDKEKSLQCNGSVTDLLQSSISISNSISNSNEDSNRVIGKEKETKHKYGNYKRVLLTDKQYTSLLEEFGETELQKWIDKVDEYIQMKGDKYKDHSAVIRNWSKKDNNQTKQEHKLLNTKFNKEFMDSLDTNLDDVII